MSSPQQTTTPHENPINISDITLTAPPNNNNTTTTTRTQQSPTPTPLKSTGGSTGGGGSVKSQPKSNTSAKFSKKTPFSTTFTTHIQIPTCFGSNNTVLECDCVRMLLLLGMIVNILSFIVIGGMTVYSFVVVNKPLLETMVSYKEMSYQYQLVTNDINLGVIGSRNDSIHDWVTRKEVLKQSVGNLLKLVESNISNTIRNEYNISDSNISLLNVHQQIVDLFLVGNLSSASTMLLSASVNSAIRQFSNGWSYLLQKIKQNVNSNFKVSQQASTTSLVIIAVCLFIAIPIVILTFSLMIRKEMSMSRKLKSTQIVLVLNTMNDSLSRKSFKNYLNQSKYLHFYNLLELIHRFKEISSTLSYVRKLLTNSANTNNQQQQQVNMSGSFTEDSDDTSSVSSSMTTDLNTSTTSSSSVVTFNSFQSIEQEQQHLKQELNQIVLEMSKEVNANEDYQKLCKIPKVQQLNVSLTSSNTTTATSGGDDVSIMLKKISFDELEKFLAEKLIQKHEKFKERFDIPLKTRCEMLKQFRVDFKRQYNRLK